MQTHRHTLTALLILLLLTFSGCGPKEQQLSLSYPGVDNTIITFQEKDIPKQCHAFAHLLIQTPPGFTGQEIKEQVLTDAGSKGAAIVLVGVIRNNNDEVEKLTYNNYGPAVSYNFQKYWQGWKYGFSDWNDGGDIVSFGVNTMADTELPFSSSLMAQAVYLHCPQ